MMKEWYHVNINGREFGTISGINPKKAIDELCQKYGFNVAPKNPELTVITKENIKKHPELFEPFIYAQITCHRKYDDELVSRLKFIDGKWYYIRPDGTSDGANIDKIDEDVAYLKKYYPELYKKLLMMNGLLKEEKPQVEQQQPIVIQADESKAHTINNGSNLLLEEFKAAMKAKAAKSVQDNKPVVTAVEPINYTYISDSSDIEL